MDAAGIATGEERTMMVSERSTGTTTLRLLLGSGYRREPSSMPSDSQIAHALYDSQTTPELSPRKSLDEILFLAQQSSGWTQVFKQMKSEGLIEEQTLGHVVARWTNRTIRSRRPTPSHPDPVLEPAEPVGASA
jgi:hypothetical protein